MENQTSPQRGEVWLVRFDPSVNPEIKKNRRAVVLNVEEVGILDLRVAVPLTDWKERYKLSPWMIHILPSSSNGITKAVAADAFQVKSLSVKRFKKRMGVLEPALVQEIAAAIALTVGYEI